MKQITVCCTGFVRPSSPITATLRTHKYFQCQPEHQQRHSNNENSSRIVIISNTMRTALIYTSRFSRIRKNCERHSYQIISIVVDVGHDDSMVLGKKIFDRFSTLSLWPNATTRHELCLLLFHFLHCFRCLYNLLHGSV